MSKYFRITGYNEKENISVIMDSNGKFNEIWEFSVYMLQKGFRIIEVSDDTQFLDGNISRAKDEPDCVVLRATDYGRPKTIEHNIDGRVYIAVQVDKKYYIPNKN